MQPQIKAVERPKRFVFDGDWSCIGKTHIKTGCVAGHASDKQCGAPVNKALGQFFMKRIGKPLLKGTGPFGPMVSFCMPIAALRGIGPCPYGGVPAGQSSDVALHGIEPRQL